MSLGTALLQPMSLSRDTQDPLLAIAEDIARLAALFVEDAAANGPMAAEAEAAATEVGDTIVTWFTATGADGKTRQAHATDRLRAKFVPVRAFIDTLVNDAGAIAGDPGQTVSLVRQLLALARGAADAATLPAIRAQLDFLKSLIEQDLGFSPDFLSQRITDYITTLNHRLGALPAQADPAARRRINLARATLARLSLHAHLLVPPGLETEPLARLLLRLLKSSGLQDALKEAGCALDGIETSLNAATAAGAAVRVDLQPINAGIASKEDAAEYAYFASWLLNDEDVPLIGLSDLDTPEQFLTTLKTSTNPVITALRAQLTDPERTALNAFTSGEPDRDLQLVILAALNREIQRAPILNLGEGLASSTSFPEEVDDLRNDYRDDQTLFEYNRRVLDHVFPGELNSLGGNKARATGAFFLNLFLWPRNQVLVTGDRRFVMCDDKPMLSGENLKWSDAPMFAGSIRGGMWFDFQHASPEFCEVWTQSLTIAGEAAKAVWHTLMIQPGHEAQSATACSVEYADTIQQVLWGKPVSAHMLQGNPHLRRWGKSLDSFWGLKGISTFASSFQSLQSEAPTEKFRFWITVLMGDIFRTLGPIQMVNAVRDILTGFVVLLNFGGPRDAPSTLPSNPAHNHKKQAPIVALSDTLFAMLLIAQFRPDNYSIMLFNPGRDDLHDQRVNAMAVHWLAGGVGMGLLAGLTGSLTAQIISWSEDFKRFFITGAKSAGKMFGLYWIYLYVFKENATEDGEYRPAGGSFRGYPERATSPYLLPFAGGTDQYCGQANLGLFSHNTITNSDFDTPANNAVLQAYAYDFGHDFRVPIACSRGGVVWSFTENLGDGTTGNWNFLTIRHTGIDNEHDRFGNAAAVQTWSVYGHLAQNGVTNAPFFGGTTPTQESVTPGSGTPVTQGDLIALAGDTGMSFHNHLHMHILPDDGTGNPSTVFAIPFVFRDARNGLVPGDGNLKSTTWYRSENS